MFRGPPSHIVMILFYVCLVPYTPRPVVGHRLLALRLELLHRVIQEEVDENGVDMRLGVLPLDLTPKGFDTPYTRRCIYTLCQQLAPCTDRSLSPVTKSMGERKRERVCVNSDLPRTCISKLLPLSSSSFLATMPSRGGLYSMHPRMARLWGMR